MVLEPAVTAVTSPVALTVATALFEVDQTKARPVSGAPFAVLRGCRELDRLTHGDRLALEGVTARPRPRRRDQDGTGAVMPSFARSRWRFPRHAGTSRGGHVAMRASELPHVIVAPVPGRHPRPSRWPPVAGCSLHQRGAGWTHDQRIAGGGGRRDLRRIALSFDRSGNSRAADHDAGDHAEWGHGRDGRIGAGPGDRTTPRAVPEESEAAAWTWAV